MLNDLSAAVINKNNIANSIAVIVLDLSTTALVINSLKFWIEELRLKFDKSNHDAFSLINKRKEIEALNENQNNIYKSHQDKNLIKPFCIPLLVVGTK